MQTPHHETDSFALIARRLLWPLLLMMLFLIAIQGAPHRWLLIIISHACFSLLIAVMCHEQRTGWHTAAMMGAFYGALISLVVAFVLFIAHINILTFFRIFSQPTIAAVSDGILTGFFYLLISSIPSTRPLLSSSLEGSESDQSSS